MQANSPQYPVPSFSRNSTGSSMNGTYPSLSAASTPTATTPAPRGHQHNMSFGMGSYGTPNGMHMQQTPLKASGDLNGGIVQQRYPPGHRPQIYTAVYSGVSVYEMEVNRIIVMRRRSDSWLNATQILKVAGVEKGKRTKILDKEILAGEHEKVQGGYGKYQGTWINYRRGVDFCRQYGVEEILRPLLEYDMGQDGIHMAGQGGVETPTKEQAMAAQRKRNMRNGGTENRPSAKSPNGTFFKNISANAANAVSAISKARFDSPGPRPGSGNRRPAAARQASQQMMGSQESMYPGSSQQSMQSLHSEGSFGGNNQLDPALRPQNGPYFMNVRRDYQQNGEVQEPPRKRVRPSSSQDPFCQPFSGDFDVSMRDTTPTEPNDSFVYHQQGLIQPDLDGTIMGLQPLPQPTSSAAIEKQQVLTSLFLDPTQTDFSKHPALLSLSAEDIDIPIDATAHTALHWAATLARIPLLRALIDKGASIFRANGGGETALIRAALTTNNLDQNSFPELLELLGPTIEMRDGRGRTVLHHIAVSSAVKGRSLACRYYLDSLLEFVVRQGSPSNSQQDSWNIHNPIPPIKSIGLARFMSEVVNAVDMSGDTALNLAARIGNKGIIQQLLEVGGNPTIPNRGGLKPVDFGVGGEPEQTGSQPSNSQPKQERSATSKVSEISRNLLASMSTVVSDTLTAHKADMQARQALIDQVTVQLREETALLNEEKRRLHEIQRNQAERNAQRQRHANLRRAEQEMIAKITADGTPMSDRVWNFGDADGDMKIDPILRPLLDLDPDARLTAVTPQQREYIESLPSSEILWARCRAYRKNNANLEAEIRRLNGKSTVLEGKMRRVVSLCTGLEEGVVDEMVDGLLVAVESEKGEVVDDGRVREFLRKVDGGGSGGGGE